MSVELLYPLLTEAIRRAETLQDLHAPGVQSAFLEVSLLEEKVAELLPANDSEGALARRGAVRAALAARELSRAQRLCERFIAEAPNDEELSTDLRQLMEQAEASAAARFPHVVASIGLQEVRRLARQLSEQGAPFPIG